MILCLLFVNAIDFRAYFALRAPDDTERNDLPEQRFSSSLESKRSI